MQRRDDWVVDTSWRPAQYPAPLREPLRLPSAVRRLSNVGRRGSFSSDIGLVDQALWEQRADASPPPADADVDADVSDYRSPSPEWLPPAMSPSPPPPQSPPLRIPSATRRLSRISTGSPDEHSSFYSSDDESRRYWSDEEGPPLPAQVWPASRQRQHMLAARAIEEEAPPWWWYPCYHADPDTPWYDPKVKFGADGFWDPTLCADHIYIACKMAVSDAINNQEQQFAKEWDTSLTNLREMFNDVDYDWMPKIAKKPEKPVDNSYYVSSTFDREVIGCHNNLQIVSVPVDQIIRDQQRGNGELLPIWFSVKTHLRQVLCDAECGLYHMNIPKIEVPRSVMPEAVRELRSFDQRVRDWIVFRDYKNIMQFYEHIFLRHAFCP